MTGLGLSYLMTELLTLIGQNENLPSIHEKHKEIFSSAKSFWEISKSFLPNRIGIGKHHHLNLCLAAVYSKQIKLFFSVYQQCYYGLPSEAMLPLRVMYETLLNLLFLERRKRPEVIAIKWLIWHFANNERQAKLIRSKSSINEETKRILKRDLKVYQNKMTNKKWKIFVRYGPSMVSLGRLAKRLRMKTAYNSFYPHVSGPNHGYDLLNHAYPNDHDGITFNITPDDKLLDLFLYTSIAILYDTLKILNHLLALNRHAQLRELKGILQSAK